MSKTTPESKEIHTICKHNADKFFDEVEKTIPQYHQSITNLQRSYVASWQKATDTAISINREFATRAGINTNAPVEMVKMVNSTTEEIINAQATQNKVMLAAIDAAQQAINSFNENAKLYTGLNQGVLQYWIQACTPTRN